MINDFYSFVYASKVCGNVDAKKSKQFYRHYYYDY